MILWTIAHHLTLEFVDSAAVRQLLREQWEGKAIHAGGAGEHQRKGRDSLLRCILSLTTRYACSSFTICNPEDKSRIACSTGAICSSSPR